MNVRTRASVPHSEFFPAARPQRRPARWLAAMAEDRRGLVQFWPVIQNMVVQELRVRYQRSMLGFLWTLLNPILMMGTIALAFSQIWQIPLADYAVYLFAGMVPWSFFTGSVNECAYCIIINEGLIRKIYLPKMVFPLTRVLINLTTFVLSMVALFLLLKPMGAQFSTALLALPFVLVLFTAFTMGLGLIVATANTFYRDCGHMVAVVLQAWYFATPIVYEATRFPAEKQWLLWLNPVFPFIRMFQLIIRDGQWPNGTLFLVAAGIATVSLGVGYASFKCHENKFIFRL
jgi:ABC-type polysaccharide/polyol phosphate export permease